MKKKITFLAVLLLVFSLFSAVDAEIVDEQTVDKMTEFNQVMAEISGLPGQIDGDLCDGDKASYRVHMTELAQLIMQANTIIKDVKLYYPIDLWYIYNQISANPVCGIGAKAGSAFNVADVSRVSNEEKMGILENEDLCMCWNIATGRDEPTGFMKDGACRCIYGTRNYNPNIGINE